LIFVCLAALHNFQGVIGQGSLQCPRRILRRARPDAALSSVLRTGRCLGMDRRDDRVRCRCQKVVDLMRPWDRLVPRSPQRRCDSAIISNEDPSTSFGLSLRSTPPLRSLELISGSFCA
jgi:hypothetical protein